MREIPGKMTNAGFPYKFSDLWSKFRQIDRRNSTNAYVFRRSISKVTEFVVTITPHVLNLTLIGHATTLGRERQDLSPNRF